MRRRTFLKSAGAGIGAAGGSIAAPAVMRAQPEIRWRCVSSYPKNLDILFGAADEIAKRIAAATDNKFQIRVFAGGEIVPGLQVLDTVQNETVECGHSASSYYVGKDATFRSIPPSLRPELSSAERLDVLWRRARTDARAVRGLQHCSISGGEHGRQMGGWFRKEIKSVEDLRGLKFRIAGLAGQVLTKLGVVPQQIAGGDLYPALERGAIDAAEWVGPYDDEKLGFVKLAPYYYYPGWRECGPQLFFYVNIKQ